MTQRTQGIEGFIRPELASFSGYAACKSPDALKGKVKRVIKLDANENNYGASPRVRRALAKFEDFNIYPDATQSELRAVALAVHRRGDAAHRGRGRQRPAD